MFRASATTNPQSESAYGRATFLSLPQLSNRGGMIAPLRGISLRMTISPYLFPTYTLGNVATNAADPLAPHNMLQDPMMSTLSPTLISYITDMVN